MLLLCVTVSADEEYESVDITLTGDIIARVRSQHILLRSITSAN